VVVVVGATVDVVVVEVVLVVVVVGATVVVVVVGGNVVDVDVDGGEVVVVDGGGPGMTCRIMPGCNPNEIVFKFWRARSLPDRLYWFAMPIHESLATTT
jgi:hypothetical protein